MTTRESQHAPAAAVNGTAPAVPRPRYGGRPAAAQHSATPVAPPRAWERPVVAAFFLVTAGVHLGVTAAAARDHAAFADDALLTGVREAWRAVFEPSPVMGGLGLVAIELLVGALLLVGGRAAVWGWGGAIACHSLLLLLGLWVWPWALPALALLVVLAHRDLARAAPDRAAPDHTGGVPG
jgi:hypothetical protein